MGARETMREGCCLFGVCALAAGAPPVGVDVQGLPPLRGAWEDENDLSSGAAVIPDDHSTPTFRRHGALRISRNMRHEERRRAGAKASLEMIKNGGAVVHSPRCRRGGESRDIRDGFARLAR